MGCSNSCLQALIKINVTIPKKYLCIYLSFSQRYYYFTLKEDIEGDINSNLKYQIVIGGYLHFPCKKNAKMYFTKFIYYFPIQKLEKILSRRSSEEISPVISPRWKSA